MSKARRLFPVDLPRCETTRTTAYSNDTEDTNLRCKKSARYEIEGRFFCSVHARTVALSILMEEH